MSAFLSKPLLLVNFRRHLSAHAGTGARTGADTRLDNLDFVQEDASTYAFADGADLVFSLAGVMFFSDPVATFANLRRALQPGGCLVLVCFRDRELNSWWTVPPAAAATVIAPEPPTPLHEPGPFLSPRRFDWVLGGNVDLATQFCINAGPSARGVTGMSDDIRACSLNYQPIFGATRRFVRGVAPRSHLDRPVNEPAIAQ